MYLNRATILGLTIALLAVGGCQPPDVGGSCTLGQGAPSGAVTTDYFATGVTECDNLICIKSQANPAATNAKNNPYCSKPCVSNSDCSQSETGLVCRAVILDDEFLSQLPEETRKKYLPNTPGSTYCAIPLL